MQNVTLQPPFAEVTGIGRDFDHPAARATVLSRIAHRHGERRNRRGTSVRLINPDGDKWARRVVESRAIESGSRRRRRDIRFIDKPRIDGEWNLADEDFESRRDRSTNAAQSISRYDIELYVR